MRLMSDADMKEEVEVLLKKFWDNIPSGQTIFTPGQSNELLTRIFQTPELRDSERIEYRPFSTLFRWAAAASVAIVVLSGTYFALRENRGSKPAPEVAHDIAPGSDKAMLTLANGRKITLDDAPVGVLVENGQVVISKSADGSLIYNADVNAGNDGTSVEYNTISTPLGGKYKVILPDGSKVWLNAGTTLKYPTRFDQKQRRVELRGEAYMEVNAAQAEKDAPGDKIPFQVLSGDQLVEVLGTHFNINSYEDEKFARTTLLEGRIKVKSVKKGNELKLVPGQRSELSSSGELKLFREADMEEAVAWKDDIFSFNGSDVYSVMRQISRWYDVEVQFENDLPREHLTGYISRKVPISSAIKMLEQSSDLKFRLEGRKVTVSNPKPAKSNTNDYN